MTDEDDEASAVEVARVAPQVAVRHTKPHRLCVSDHVVHPAPSALVLEPLMLGLHVSRLRGGGQVVLNGEAEV